MHNAGPSDPDLTLQTTFSDDHIAVVGLAGRFPGAPDVATFWKSLDDGVDLSEHFETNDPSIVGVRYRLEDAICFDAAFFGFSPAEAALMDPQHRLFLETAWHALEDAGYGNTTKGKVVGVFAAAGFNDYVLKHVGPHTYKDSSADYFAMLLANDKDFLATRTAYLLDLNGPAMVVQSACSSGLLCVHQGIQSLLQGEVDMALSGAVSVTLDLDEGYHADAGGPLSPTGRVAPFSDDATGVVGSNGVAVVVLKRLADALADRDRIYAVIEASAANNDGRDRATFTAPGVEGQKRVLAEALALSNRKPADIAYIEAHGTGTRIGDPIEMEAVRTVYGAAETPCLVGSVKGNVGHLNTVAGLAGLLKAIHVVHTGTIPPTANFSTVNPLLKIEGTRFSIADRLSTLPRDEGVCAAVSSFGFGGTNVHMILSTPPGEMASAADTNQSDAVLLGWSARTPEDLEAMDANLEAFWERGGNDKTSNHAATLFLGRKAFPQRRAIIADTCSRAASKIRHSDDLSPASPSNGGGFVFAFSGQGTQFPTMGRQLYEKIAVYRAAVDACARAAMPLTGFDIRDVLFAEDEEAIAAVGAAKWVYTPVSVFTTQYALARTWQALGVEPDALVGHSLGEYTAACIAGVFSMEDALNLIYTRAALMESVDFDSRLLSVHCDESTLRPLLNDHIYIAVYNRSDRIIVAGKTEDIEAFRCLLEGEGVYARLIDTTTASHCALMESIVDEFRNACSEITFAALDRPVLSNISGTLATDGDLTTPDYWADQLRRPVRFAENIAVLNDRFAGSVCLEMGPGSSCIATVSAEGPNLTPLPTMLSQETQWSDFLRAVGRLWVGGVSLDLSVLFEEGTFRKTHLPGYPFRKTPHCLPRLDGTGGFAQASCKRTNRLPFDQWIHVPVWQPFPVSETKPAGETPPLLAFVARDVQMPDGTICVLPGDTFEERDAFTFTVRPGNKDDFEHLSATLKNLGLNGLSCVFAWKPDPVPDDTLSRKIFFDSMVLAAQVTATDGLASHFTLWTRDLAVLTGTETARPEQALALGILRTLPYEYADLSAVWIDADIDPDPEIIQKLQHLQREAKDIRPASIALRNGRFWERRIVSSGGFRRTQDITGPEAGATYVVVGASGGIGRSLVRQLASVPCRIVCLGRSVASFDDSDGEEKSFRDQCEESGARLTLIPGSVTDLDLLRDTAERLQKEEARVDTVFHLASRFIYQTLQDITLDETDTNIEVKARGAACLIEAFAPLAPKRMVAFSSLADEVSAYGNADYKSGNLYLDFLAQSQQTPFPVITIGWDYWAKSGAMGKASGDLNLGLGAEENAIAHEDGLRAMWRAIGSGYAHVFVSPVPISYWLDIPYRPLGAEPDVPAASENTSPSVISISDNPLQQAVQILFSQCLGIDPIRPNDDFIELGGDSIMAVRLLSKMRKIFRIDFSMPDFLLYRTPASLTAFLADFPGTRETACAYLHVQTLSDQEKRALRRMS